MIEQSAEVECMNVTGRLSDG